MQSQQFFYQRGAHSNRNEIAGKISPAASEEEYSSGEEIETERERQKRLEKARAEMQQRIQKYKETKWKDKAPSIKLPASKVKLFQKKTD